MNRNFVTLNIAVLLVFGVVISGCGGGSSKAGKQSEVKTITTDDASVVVGDQVDLFVDFTFSTDTVVHDNHNVTVIVSIPRGLQFEADTARIAQIIGSTRGVTPSIENCTNGGAFLTFDLGQSVLSEAADQSGGANARLILTLNGTEAIGTVSLEALAGYDFEVVNGSCAQGMVPQDTTPITVG